MIKPELEQSIVSIDDVISLNDDEDGGDDDEEGSGSASISATHAMIEKAAKKHLPETAERNREASSKRE